MSVINAQNRFSKYSEADIKLFLAEVQKFYELLDTVEAIAPVAEKLWPEKPIRFNPDF